LAACDTIVGNGLIESGKRADELATAGDDARAAIWRRIEDAAEKLAITWTARITAP
jgi:hypothetical protein